MDEVFIQALITQALAAYTKGGDEALAQWKLHLPLPHREQFERDGGERLKEAMASLGHSVAAIDPPKVERKVEREETTAPKFLGNAIEPSAKDPRKKHTRDQRRTKPL